MLRLESETGWWLITHVDHAQLAGAFAAQWGNDLFSSPEPREHVLRGISTHDDGWAARDSRPQITSQGKPSAFSVELVGKYSAFEEIDLVDYLAVRERAVHLVAEADAYAALLVSMHTHNLLTARADRTTIQTDQLPLLDAFLDRQLQFQQQLKAQVVADGISLARVDEHFRLLQATDNLSLLSCVDFRKPSHLLHPLPLRDGRERGVEATPLGERHFRLDPYPFAVSPLVFEFPARHVEGKEFVTAESLQKEFDAAPPARLLVTFTR
jgi:hypothetical protein